MRWFGIPLFVALASCATLPTYRDMDVQLSSMAVFDPVRYVGNWYEVASFPVAFQAGCSNTTATYGAASDGTLSVLNRCDTGSGTKTISGNAQVVGPGRLKVRLAGVPVAADYWVLWVDEGYRTAVIGVPSGRAGWILNREATIPQDRLKAARDVLEFNGYNLGQLKMTTQESR